MAWVCLHGHPVHPSESHAARKEAGDNGLIRIRQELTVHKDAREDNQSHE